jgi:hypothetical protein
MPLTPNDCHSENGPRAGAETAVLVSSTTHAGTAALGCPAAPPYRAAKPSSQAMIIRHHSADRVKAKHDIRNRISRECLRIPTLVCRMFFPDTCSTAFGRNRYSRPCLVRSPYCCSATRSPPQSQRSGSTPPSRNTSHNKEKNLPAPSVGLRHSARSRPRAEPP